MTNSWRGAGPAAPLGVKDQVGEVFFLGLDAEIVVSNAVPLVIEQADETNDEEERQSDAETWEADYMESV